MRKNYNSETKQSIRLGHGHAFISQIRCNNNDKYCYIKALSDTGYFEDGYIKYRVVREKVLNEFLQLMDTLIDNRWVASFERDSGCIPFKLQHLPTRLRKVQDITWYIMREMELLIPHIENFIRRRTRHEQDTKIHRLEG